VDIRQTSLPGVHVIAPKPFGDERGFFARMFDSDVFEAAGLIGHFVNINNSLSRHRGTMRGMHLQLAPSAEAKLVRCVRGALFDVAVDTRPGSPTCCQWYGHELTAENRLMMYVPEGFAHAFVTLADDTEAIYLSSQFYDPARERGLRWNDPAIGVQWPVTPEVVSNKDQAWGDYDPANFR
jgi:dTDP-4-dehydrorhamnose 3,5-epimerase